MSGRTYSIHSVNNEVSQADRLCNDCNNRKQARKQTNTAYVTCKQTHTPTHQPPPLRSNIDTQLQGISRCMDEVEGTLDTWEAHDQGAQRATQGLPLGTTPAGTSAIRGGSAPGAVARVVGGPQRMSATVVYSTIALQADALGNLRGKVDTLAAEMEKLGIRKVRWWDCATACGIFHMCGLWLYTVQSVGGLGFMDDWKARWWDAVHGHEALIESERLPNHPLSVSVHALHWYMGDIPGASHPLTIPHLSVHTSCNESDCCAPHPASSHQHCVSHGLVLL